MSVVALGLGSHDLVQKLALTVLLAGLDVRLGNGVVSRSMPPRWAVTTIKPALGGASRMTCHSSFEKSDLVVISSPVCWYSLVRLEAIR